MIRSSVRTKLICLIFSALNCLPAIVAGDGIDKSALTNETEADTSNRALTGDLYDLLYHAVIIDTSKRQANERRDFFDSEEYFMPYRGSLITSIRFKQVPTFVGSVYDTSLTPASDLAKFANSVHIATRNFVITKNLLFAPNDTVAPFLLADNERILRTLPFIRDARIYLKPLTTDSSQVELTIVTQDIFPIGIGGSVSSVDNFNLDIYDRNLFGMGWEWNNGLRYRAGQDPQLGYDGRFYVNNIKGSFISGYLNYINVQEREAFIVSFDKVFSDATNQICRWYKI